MLNRLWSNRWLVNGLIILAVLIIIANLLPLLRGLPVDRWWLYKTTGSVLTAKELADPVVFSPIRRILLHEVQDGSKYIPGTRAHLIIVETTDGDQNSVLVITKHIRGSQEAVLYSETRRISIYEVK